LQLQISCTLTQQVAMTAADIVYLNTAGGYDSCYLDTHCATQILYLNYHTSQLIGVPSVDA